MQSCKKFAFASSAGHRERDRVNSVDLKKITILRRKRSGISGMAGTGKGGWEVHKIKEFLHQAVHVVFSYIVASQRDSSTVHVPETGEQMAERGLAAAGRADDGRGRPLGNVQCDSIDDGFFAIREVNVLCVEVMVLRRKLRTGNIHGGLQPAVIFSRKGIGFHFGNSLDKLQYPLNHCRITGQLSICRFFRPALQSVIDKVVDQQTCNDEQSNTPVKKKHRQRHNCCGEDTLCDEHDHASGHAGEMSATAAHHRIEAVFQTCNELITTAVLCSLFHLGIRCVGPTHADIFPNGVIEQKIILGYIGNESMVVFCRDTADVRTAHGDAADLGQIVGELHAADNGRDKSHRKDHDEDKFFIADLGLAEHLNDFDAANVLHRRNMSVAKTTTALLLISGIT